MYVGRYISDDIMKLRFFFRRIAPSICDISSHNKVVNVTWGDVHWNVEVFVLYVVDIPWSLAWFDYPETHETSQNLSFWFGGERRMESHPGGAGHEMVIVTPFRAGSALFV